MDHYPQVNVSEREYPSSASHHDSGSSLNPAIHSPPELIPQQAQPTAENPSPSDPPRKDSATAPESDDKLKANIARYTDAPPPYSPKQYEGKSEEETSRMRMVDYAKEISRQMGRQLLRGVKGGKA